MNRYLKYIASVFLIFIFTLHWLEAQNVQFTCSAPRVIETGEQFELTYSISAQPSGFRPPEFKNFSLLGGPSTSSSSNIQIINGKVTQSTTIIYSYYLAAPTAGKFTLESAVATVNGKNYQSNPVVIEVVGTNRQNPNQGGQQNNQAQQNQDISDIGNEDFFARIFVDRNNVYQGEYLVATIKIFTKYDIYDVKKEDYPSFNDFFSQDIEIPKPALVKENVNGKIYKTALLKKIVLFPQKSGECIIDPYTIECVIGIPVRTRPQSIFDEFFGGGQSVKQILKRVKSTPVKVYIKPLPANKPASFQGAVGNFTFKTSIDKKVVKTNDAINLKITVSGNGNLKVIEAPDIDFPSDFETYDPKTNVNTTVTVAGVTGSKTFEYLVIPRHSGDFKIHAVEFTYFDPLAKQYKTLSSGEIEIKVEKGANENVTTIVSGVSKEDVKFLGKDIQFIKVNAPDFRNINYYFFGSLKFFLFYLVSLLLFVMLVLFWRKRIRENANIAKVRNKKANKVAHKRLKDAHLYMKDNKNEEFHEYILKALWGYMSDKLAIPAAELTREKVQEESILRNIDPEYIQKFLEILDTCEYARYAPVESVSQMDNVYKDAISVISKIEQSIK